MVSRLLLAARWAFLLDANHVQELGLQGCSVGFEEYLRPLQRTLCGNVSEHEGPVLPPSSK